MEKLTPKTVDNHVDNFCKMLIKFVLCFYTVVKLLINSIFLIVETVETVDKVFKVKLSTYMWITLLTISTFFQK